MTSPSVLRNLTSITLLACCGLGLANAGAQTYDLTDLGVLPGQIEGASMPAAINPQAQVAGTSGGSAFLYTKTNKVPMQDVGADPEGSITRGFGINLHGQVVGDSTFGGGSSHAALFSKGYAVDLGTLKVGGLFSRANGINASGQVVGYSSQKPDLDFGRAFMVSTSDNSVGEMVDLGTMGGDWSQAWAINDSGFVTGNSQVENNNGPTHAFIWGLNTGMVDLGTIAGASSYGTALSAKNHVVGYSTINNVDERVHAFLHDGAKIQDLGSLGGASVESDYSFALGVNAHDQVVGYSYLPNSIPSELPPLQVAFICRQGLMVDLNGLIGTTAAKYRLYSATAINDNGQIVAIAFHVPSNAVHAVLLTPKPIRIGTR